ncbi:carboxypeptidase O-like [Pelobates cultripes]|uniref:Carboxypeptidase O-like n=1 Tax=Pelobates cultripes TaxID=61616 RepID=A0AAD1WHI1_PELCU|nr:carboxypeptidase O-like [Pelobates cultripes]
MIPDVQKVIQHQTMVAPENQKISLNNFDYTKYHPMHEIYDWMTQIREEYDDIVTLHHLGTTYEQRPIFYFKIGWPSDQKKKIIWMDCGIHAREWISVAFCQWFIREILENQHSNPVLNKALRNIDFYIVPVLNIDGFIYSWTTDRLWRKSRSSHKNGTCYGVDLNRNFDAQWCSIGASENCSTLTYCGTGPNSEPESAAVADLVGSLKSEILCFLTIHSYSQLILLPYGYTKDPSKNHEEMLTVAEKAAAKLQQRHGTTYKVGSSAHILFAQTGKGCGTKVPDWVNDLKVNLSYTFELRDEGDYGFELPPDQIEPTCEETMDALMGIIDYINENYLEDNAVSITSVWMTILLSYVVLLICWASYDLRVPSRYQETKVCLRVQYDGDQVLKITPQTDAHAQYLRELAERWMLDLWKPDMTEDIATLREIHVRIPYSHVEEMKEKLLQQAIPFTIIIEDLQKLIDKSTVTDRKIQKISLESYDYKKYHPMTEIYEWMDEVKERHGDLITHHYLGSSYEHRPIYYFKIGWPSDKQKKVVVMDCGIHAREWIAVAFCQWFVKEILANYKSDRILPNVLSQVDFYIIPVLNVDGYIYSWTHDDRLWRKNRSVQENGTCYGVDLNRNFDSHWCSGQAKTEQISSLNSSHDVIFIYCGPSPASEMETQALVALVEEHKTEILCYLNFHSYGQLILYAYGYSYNISENHDELLLVHKARSGKVSAQIRSVPCGCQAAFVECGIRYNDAELSRLDFDALSGSSADWVNDLKINLSYIFELRDEGDYGFELPPDQIEPTCSESVAKAKGVANAYHLRLELRKEHINLGTDVSAHQVGG